MLFFLFRVFRVFRGFVLYFTCDGDTSNEGNRTTKYTKHTKPPISDSTKDLGSWPPKTNELHQSQLSSEQPAKSKIGREATKSGRASLLLRRRD